MGGTSADPDLIEPNSDLTLTLSKCIGSTKPHHMQAGKELHIPEGPPFQLAIQGNPNLNHHAENLLTLSLSLTVTQIMTLTLTLTADPL